MTRLSQRVSGMWSAVKCPGCGNSVRPAAPIAKGGSRMSTAEDDKRWSFLWAAPRGDFCPECDFPLSKYFGRLKWIRTLMVGVAISLVALILQFIGAIGLFGFAYIRVMRAIVLFGAVVACVGAAGVVIGGRHGRVNVSRLR